MLVSLRTPSTAEVGVAQAEACLQVYDIFKPNSKFSRKLPDPVAFRLALGARRCPALWQIHQLQALSAGVPVRLACVNGGDVSFVELQTSNLPVLMP